MSRQEVSKQELLIPFSPNTSYRSGLQNRICLWRNRTISLSPSSTLLVFCLLFFLKILFSSFFSLPLHSLTLSLFFIILFRFRLIILFLCLNLLLMPTNTPDDGRLRPKHVEWLCRNKTCTVLHQVGVSFDLYYDARKHKIKIPQTCFQCLKDLSFSNLKCCPVLIYLWLKTIDILTDY